MNDQNDMLSPRAFNRGALFEFAQKVGSKDHGALSDITHSVRLRTGLKDMWVEDVLCIWDEKETLWMMHSPVIIRLEYRDLYIERAAKGSLKILVGVADTDERSFIHWAREPWSSACEAPRCIWRTYPSFGEARGSKIRELSVSAKHRIPPLPEPHGSSVCESRASGKSQKTPVSECRIVMDNGLELRVSANKLTCKHLR